MKKPAPDRRNTKKKASRKKSTGKKPTKAPEASSRRGPLSMVFVLCLLMGLALFGWWWKMQLVYQGTQITGTQFANPDTLLHKINIDSTTLFFDIKPQIVARQVAEDPWVEYADVSRLPNAILSISVTERTPALLLIDADGKPDRFIDRDGFQMPFGKQAVFDVPLLFGLEETFHPSEPIQHPALQDLLNALQQIPEDVDALISAFTIKPDGEIFLQTNPIPGRGSIDARLGKDDYSSKLTRLHAFWHQTVLAKRDYKIQAIDLRFDSQIITNEVRLSQ